MATPKTTKASPDKPRPIDQPERALRTTHRTRLERDRESQAALERARLAHDDFNRPVAGKGQLAAGAGDTYSFLRYE